MRTDPEWVTISSARLEGIKVEIAALRAQVDQLGAWIAELQKEANK